MENDDEEEDDDTDTSQSLSTSFRGGASGGPGTPVRKLYKILQLHDFFLKDFTISYESAVYKEYEIYYGFMVSSTDLHAVFETEESSG
ncbi:hypothetical protein AVEN_156975-1 [Araneus ventricosus]|uniref:Uncharacterized protein n=1 Tax=Araneus ventricosus TaxID=182803 RepID=A0A4Y2HKR1_ARAVE|nr:hypothetical protein AVEN_156975-1 [Araneus ventricosus]